MKKSKLKVSSSEQNELFKYLIQNMPVCIDALDENGNIVFWNHECERVTGYSAKEIIGNPAWLKILYPNEKYRNQLLNQWAKKGNNFRNWDMELQTKDGRKRTLSWSNLSDIYSVPGWQSWAIGIDVTSRIESEKKLEQASHNFQTLLKIQKDLQKARTPEQIASVVLDHLKKYFNVEGGLVLLYDTSKGIAEIITAKFENSLFYHADYSIPLKYLLRYKDLKNGNIAYVDDLSAYDSRVKIARLLINQGMQTGVLVPMFLDNEVIGSLSLFSAEKLVVLPEHKDLLIHAADQLSLALRQNKLIEQLQNKLIELEQKSISQLAELKRNEHRLRAQYESIPIPTYTWQKNGDDFILIDYNDMAMAASYGRIGEYLGHKASEIYKNIPELVDLLKECYEHEISMETQIETIRGKDKHHQYLLIKLAYVAPDSVLMHQEDITDQIQAKQQILRLHNTIEQQEQTIQQLHSDLSLMRQMYIPTLKQYLNRMKTLKKSLSAQVLHSPNNELNTVLEQWEESNKNMLSFLKYLEIEQSFRSESVVIEEINFTELVQKLLDDSKKRLENVQTHVYLEAASFKSDKKLLRQALSSLLNFMLNHLPRARKPVLRLISTTDHKGQILITLKDNGNGLPYTAIQIENDLIESEPTPFDQEFLDLLFVRKITRLLGGEFKISSSKGEGATFTLRLPQESEEHSDEIDAIADT